MTMRTSIGPRNTRTRAAVATIVSTVLFGASGVGAAPKLGDKSPPIIVEQWVSGKPNVLPGQSGADKHVFVLEFWATWCGPCRQTIPHLNKLHEKLRGKGLIVLGLSNEEPEVISAYLKKNKMQYAVGAYSEESDTSAWMKEVDGIPTAYVIDRAGKVVWTGHPLAGMDEVVEKVIAGTYDVAAARKQAADARRLIEIQGNVREAFRGRNYSRALELIDQWIAIQKDNPQPYYIRQEILRAMDRPASQREEVAAAMEAAVQDNAESLRSVAIIELGKGAIAERDPVRALRAARRSVELTQGKDAECLQTLAHVQATLGLIDEAIETQRAAVQLLGDDPAPEPEANNNDPEYGRAEDPRAVLKYYERLREARRAAASPPLNAPAAPNGK
ncbi:MAG: TlpA family protein disulfide reductase [Phycisphaerae bacterium]|nr:TlpA family protein disulfide reductase [Phycisphaerae bacterium]